MYVLLLHVCIYAGLYARELLKVEHGIRNAILEVKDYITFKYDIL